VKVHCWAEPPVQSHIQTGVPLAVPLNFTSRDLPFSLRIVLCGRVPEHGQYRDFQLPPTRSMRPSAVNPGRRGISAPRRGVDVVHRRLPRAIDEALDHRFEILPLGRVGA